MEGVRVLFLFRRSVVGLVGVVFYFRVLFVGDGVGRVLEISR